VVKVGKRATIKFNLPLARGICKATRVYAVRKNEPSFVRFSKIRRCGNF
jgi:hypothetical protein